MSKDTTTQTFDDVPYDPNDPESVEQFWSDAKVRKGRGKQKNPTKEQVTIRLSPQVVEYFKSGGTGWQTRIDSVLKEYIDHK